MLQYSPDVHCEEGVVEEIKTASMRFFVNFLTSFYLQLFLAAKHRSTNWAKKEKRKQTFKFKLVINHTLIRLYARSHQ